MTGGLLSATGAVNINFRDQPGPCSHSIDIHTDDWGKARPPAGTYLSSVLCYALKRASVGVGGKAEVKLCLSLTGCFKFM